jgi:hypothetical protein
MSETASEQRRSIRIDDKADTKGEREYENRNHPEQYPVIHGPKYTS